LPTWLLLSSALLAGAVVMGLLAQRVRLQLTVVLVGVGFAARLVGDSYGLDSPLEGEGFEEVVVFLFLPVSCSRPRSACRSAPSSATSDRSSCWRSWRCWSRRARRRALAVVLGIPLAAALLFGALISATDPVAVVAVFRELGVPERLLVPRRGREPAQRRRRDRLFTILLSAALGRRRQRRGRDRRLS
jgi:CPA1 family monovalent cation:H+ antiporter